MDEIMEPLERMERMGARDIRPDDETAAELTVGAVRELVERLDKLTKRLDIITDAVRGHGACVEAHQELIKRLEQRLSKLEQADDCDACQESSFIAALRAAGVTRYKRGDLEIELSQGPLVSAPGLEQWLPDRDRVQPNDDWRKAWPEEPCTPEERAEREAREGISAGIEKAAHEAGWLDEQGRPTDALKEVLFARFGPTSVSPLELDDPPEPEPPVEQPPVEIDMAAVEELIKKQDAKRQGMTE